MLMSHVILLALAPIFSVMVLGYVAGRFHRIDNRHVAGLNSLVMEFSLPAALFMATASTPRGEMIEQGPFLAILCVAMLIPYLLWFYCRNRILRLPRGEAAVEALSVSLPNYAAVGLPLLVAILGPKEAVHVAVAIAAGSILPSPITLVLLELSAANRQASAESTGARLWRVLRRALGKPIVLAPIAGLILSISGLEPGDVVRASFRLIGQTAGGVALFLTGLILSAQPFRLDRKVVVATTVANVIQPLFVAAIVYVFAVPLNIARPAILLAALPSGFFGILFGVNYEVVSAEAGSIVIASTAASVVTLAIAIVVLIPQ